MGISMLVWGSVLGFARPRPAQWQLKPGPRHGMARLVVSVLFSPLSPYEYIYILARPPPPQDPYGRRFRLQTSQILGVLVLEVALLHINSF